MHNVLLNVALGYSVTMCGIVFKFQRKINLCMAAILATILLRRHVYRMKFCKQIVASHKFVLEKRGNKETVKMSYFSDYAIKSH